VIRVDVTLLPHGRVRGAAELGRIEIVNDGTGDEYFGNYDVEVQTPYKHSRVRIENYQRDQGWGPLVAEALHKELERIAAP
jgi:hypothetical protein